MKLITSILLTLIITLVSPAISAKMYKWTDANGKIFFSDKVPPDQIQNKRELIDNSGQTVGVVEKPKTKEQIDMDKRLNLKRQELEERIAVQEKADQKLLSNFLSLPAMEASHKSELQILDGRKKEKEQAIVKINEEIAQQQKQAAEHDRNNTKAPKALLDKMESNQKNLAKLKADILELDQKKIASEKKYQADRSRYEYLTKTKKEVVAVVEETAEGAPAKKISLPGVYECKEAVSCDKAWNSAKEFVKAHSTTKNIDDTNEYFRSADPLLDKDLSLSASKVTGEDKMVQIFLDVRCSNTLSGKELCVSATTENLRQQFVESLNKAAL